MLRCLRVCGMIDVLTVVRFGKLSLIIMYISVVSNDQINAINVDRIKSLSCLGVKLCGRLIQVDWLVACGYILFKLTGSVTNSSIVSKEWLTVSMLDGCNLIMPEDDRGVGVISVWHVITMQSIPPYPQCQPFNLCLLLDNKLLCQLNA